MWSGRQARIATSPEVTAAARAKVPASIRSGMTRWRQPWSASTPWMCIVREPAPSMRAPMADRSRARSSTSGSQAALSSTVSPFASAAAIIRFSVPVTVTPSSRMLAPRSPPVVAST